VARRKFDQYFRAGAVGLAQQTDTPAARVATDPGVDDSTPRIGVALNGHSSTAGHLNGKKQIRPRAALTRPQKCALALAVVSIGVSAFLGARTWSTLVPISVPVLLSGVVWTNTVWLLRAWRRRGSIAATRPAMIDLEPGHSREVQPEARRAVLLLAIAASLLWLVWVRPGPWQDGLAIAVTLALATQEPRWIERHTVAVAHRVLGPPARYFTRRIGVLDRMWRAWGRVSAAGRATAGLLVLLNVLITLALLDTAKLSSGLWAVHTTIAFAVMSGVNVPLLKSSLPSSPRAKSASARDYLLALEPIKTDTTDRSHHNGRINGHQHPAEQVERPERPSAEPAATRAGKPPKFRRPQILRSPSRVHTAMAAAAVLLTAGWIGYAHPGPLLILAVLVVGTTMISTLGVSRDQAITMVLAVALGVAAVDYMSWRFSVTNWQGWFIAVPLLWAEALGAIHVLGYQFTVWPWPPPAIEPTEDPTQHAIFILIPTVNEGVATVRPTLEGCIAARQKYLAQYPNGQVTIVVCNDGQVAKYPGWAEIDMLAQELGVRCVTRNISGGAKAGNIENARQECQVTGAALLVIFDADQVAEPDFLLKTVPPFADPKVGWVQTGQYYSNLDNPVSRWADDQQSMFYNLLCPGKAALNSAFICGTNVVIRAAALDEIGGLPQDSVTEDFAASIALHRSWRSIYLTDVLATGLGPLDVPSYLKQQGRWALGTLAVFRGHWHDILLPKKNGLRFGQRVQYLLACTHYLCGLRDLIYVLSPVLFIFTGIPAVRTATLSQYLWHFVPYGVLGLAAMWYSTRDVTGVRGIIIGFGSSPALIGSLVAALLWRKKSFAVTSKQRQGQRSLGYLAIYVLAVLLCISALAWATQATGRQATSLFISLLWIGYSLLLLASFLWLACQDIRLQATAQRSGATEITAKRPYPAKLLFRRKSLRPVLNLGLAALIASPLLFGTRLASLPVFVSAAKPFVITQQQVAARYAGVTLPVQSLRTEPPALESALGIRFSIVGRTQDITDRFDAAWAGQLAAQGARPFVVLQLGTFGPRHEPPLTASLTAIFNGVDDREITRWAAEIRDFGKPVYLAVLLQADRNWSVSSGVANGGIPEDVPRAWLHIQSIFRAVGADNVAWVWAPADPLHDQQFAPPPSTINVVLQDFINYPGTRWGNPQQVLQSLIRRYPAKPLFIEVSVSGPAAQKAAWLARLGHALDANPQVYALLYHEGGPALNPTPAQARSWSVASDPKSLAAWKRIATRPGGSHGD
jgi:cellulose synthase/poly-beta-1,6-N-acetylglucosamine synthase-like glycosyltransferase